ASGEQRERGQATSSCLFKLYDDHNVRARSASKARRRPRPALVMHALEGFDARQVLERERGIVEPLRKPRFARFVDLEAVGASVGAVDALLVEIDAQLRARPPVQLASEL